ncbi:GFA family protein [Phenylobacterium montanum]|uniref:GFA family protein n=1 Tax=Phenylobacterium montanum TaxID=2823693 RepID=A0A975G1P5_9CAUL|nr:GFA family protein [Caulobacter sp. S6]QUD89480.1 GFA family protein [Caulobacter sp. S6]
MMLTGGCACGRVSYEVDAAIPGIAHCHCRTCRKTHAAAFASLASVPRDRFRWTQGEELLNTYESSPGKLRRFCPVCGSHLVAERVGQPNVMLRLGCLDTPVTVDRQWHIWRSDGASWYDPGEAYPELPEGFPKR